MLGCGKVRENTEARSCDKVSIQGGGAVARRESTWEAGEGGGGGAGESIHVGGPVYLLGYCGKVTDSGSREKLRNRERRCCCARYLNVAAKEV